VKRALPKLVGLGLSIAIALGTLAPCPAAVKNVILMIADGSGFNAWNAASMYQGRWDSAKNQSRQVYDQPGWTRLACCTFPLTMSKVPTKTGAQDAKLIYDPAQAWDKEKPYEWLKSTYTDSAAAATALSTGKKSYNHAINWSDLDQPLKPTLSEAAKAAGKRVGVITTVEWSHATPASLSNAHEAQRDEYSSIARQMVEGGVMDVIMGAGNPDFDNNGRPVKRKDPAQVKEAAAKAKEAAAKAAASKPAPASTNGSAKNVAATTKKEADKEDEDKDPYKYVGGIEAWKAIEAARAKADGTYRGFRPVSTKAEFEALLTGPAPAKVLGTAQVYTTLQQARAGAKTDDPAGDTPLSAGLPDLALMSRAALRVLDNKPHGFFLMIEGGAVDWANHRNQPGRMIQEQIDFVQAVEAVVQWVEANSNWDETLLILTADHETGLLWGPKSDEVPFDGIVDNGAGKMPGLKYHLKTHSNSLVPLYARGPGSEALAKRPAGKDPVRGPYVDNTTVAQVLQSAVGGAAASKKAPAAPAGNAPRKRARLPLRQ